MPNSLYKVSVGSSYGIHTASAYLSKVRCQGVFRDMLSRGKNTINPQ